MNNLMTQEELDKIIALHKQWLKDESTGERAGIADKNISGLIFKDCCLDGAVFLRTNLTKCKFNNVDLSNCQFIKTNFYVRFNFMTYFIFHFIPPN